MSNSVQLSRNPFSLKLKVNQEQNDAAKKIQRCFFPNRNQAVEVINHHESDLKLGEVSSKERKIFIDEVKAGQFAKVALRKNAIKLALSAFKRGFLNYEQLATVMELSQLCKDYGISKVEVNEGGHETYTPGIIFHKFLNEDGSLTVQGKKILIKFRDSQTPVEGFKSISAAEYEVLSKKVIKYILEHPCANIVYHIIAPKPDFNVKSEKPRHDLRDTVDLNVILDEDNFIAPSICAQDAVGLALFGKVQWFKSEFRLGTLTREQIDKEMHRSDRPASISSEDVTLPSSVEGSISIMSVGYTQHDYFHRIEASEIDAKIRNALKRVQFIIRETTGFHWSYESWAVTDMIFSDNSVITGSQEKLFFSAFRGFFKVDLWPNLSFKEKQKLNREIKAKGELVLNKNQTSVALWIMIMDMVDHEDIWAQVLNIDINNKELHYDHHISFYQSLRHTLQYKTLKQRIYVLEKAYHLFDKDRKAYAEFNYSGAWDRFKDSFTLPADNDLSFKKLKKNQIMDDSMLGTMEIVNSIYLQVKAIESI